MRKCKDANGKFVSSFCHEILDTPTFDYTNDRYWRWLLTVFDKIAIFQQGTECTTVSQASAGFYRTIAELMGRADILKSPHGDIVRSANLYIQRSFEAFLIADSKGVKVSLENPAGALSWKWPLYLKKIQPFLGTRFWLVTVAYCAFGKPYQKLTHILTNVQELTRLNKFTCKCQDKHSVILQGGTKVGNKWMAITKSANGYPLKLARLWCEIMAAATLPER